MTISFVLMGSRELQSLIRTQASGDILFKDIVKFVSAVDVLLEIEHIKKRWRMDRILRMIREGECRFYEATSKGYVYTAPLDTNAVQTGLFVSDDSFYDVRFWEAAVDRRTDPSYSARLVSFRSYDVNCGTHFHLEILGHSYGEND